MASQNKSDLLKELAFLKKKIKMLELKETKYRTIADFTYDWEFWISSEGNFNYNSPSCEEISGYTPLEFSTDSNLFRRIIHPDDLYIWDSHRNQCIKKKRGSKIEFRIINKNKTIFWIEHLCNPVLNKQGKFLGIRGSNRNITERKENEKKLELQAQLLDSTSESIVLLDEKKNIIYANHASSETHGYTKKELLSMNIHNLYNKKKSKLVSARLQKKFSNESLTFESEQKKKDGNSVFLEIQVKKIKLDGKEYLLNVNRDISERKNSEKILKDSEKLFRSLFETSSDSIFLIDKETKDIINANPAACKLYGYSLNEFNKMKIIDISAEPEETEKAVNNTITEVPLMYHRRKNGTIFPVEISGGYFEQQNKIIHTTFVHDISEKKITENALRNSEQRFLPIFNSSLICICLTRLSNGQIIDINSTFLNLLGYKYNEIIDKNFLDLNIFVNPFERINMIEILKKNKRFDPFETIIRTKSGNLRNVLIVSELIKLTDDQYILELAIDITDWRKTEEALRENEKKYEEMIELLPLGIAEIDINGNITFINSKLLEYISYTLEEFKINIFNIKQVISEKEIDKFRNNIQKLLNDEINILAYECSIVKKDNKFLPVNIISYSIIKDDEITGIRNIIIDIEDRIRLEYEMQKNAKLESLGILAGGIAHDFNNILSGIKIDISLIKQILKPEESEGICQILSEADNAVKRATLLTQQLLTFSKGGTPIKSIVSIEQIIFDSAEFATRGSKSKCYYEFEKDLWLVEIDAGQIGQVIHNMVINSVQAMSEGGKIEISVMNYDNKKFLNSLLDADKYLKINIKDEGLGIPKEQINNIFDPYFTLKNTGSGLGLAICHSIIKKHNGIIEVNSESGKGTIFSIYLIADDKIKTEKTEKYCEEKKYFLDIEKILFMDDDDGIINSVEFIFTNMKIKADYAKNGLETIEFYKKALNENKPYDIVFLDLTIPGGMGGKETMEKLKKIDENIKVIVMSGYSDDQVISDYKNYGFKAVLIKPFDFNMFINAIKDSLN